MTTSFICPMEAVVLGTGTFSVEVPGCTDDAFRGLAIDVMSVKDRVETNSMLGNATERACLEFLVPVKV